jgi:hypothetical protein
MIAASKDTEHKDKTLAQLVALITDKSEPFAAPAEESSTAPQSNEPSQSTPKGHAIHAAYSAIFNELETLTEDLLRQYPLPPPVQDDLITLLREKADLVETA